MLGQRGDMGEVEAHGTGKPVREVTGTEKTLIECVNEGAVPKPPLVDQHGWLKGRSGAGRRPSAKRTGEVGTKMGQEMKLWKATVELLGPDWLRQMSE